METRSKANQFVDIYESPFLEGMENLPQPQWEALMARLQAIWESAIVEFLPAGTEVISGFSKISNRLK